MKKIYKSKSTGCLYADSEDDYYVWKRGRATGKWYILERGQVYSGIFNEANIYTGAINLLPPDWKMSMRDKIIRAF